MTQIITQDVWELFLNHDSEDMRIFLDLFLGMGICSEQDKVEYRLERRGPNAFGKGAEWQDHPCLLFGHAEI